MKLELSPVEQGAARAAVLVLVEELRLAQLNYDAAFARWLRTEIGTTESSTWRRHTTRWRNEITSLVVRLNRARATAEGRAWLRAL
jgi:hypothetical protein